MRQIKFRAKAIGGEWVSGNLSLLTKPINSEHIPAGCYISNAGGRPFAYQVIPETVGQFTGARDRNGIEIYEGILC